MKGFKYLGSAISKEGRKLEKLSKIAQTTAALSKRKPIWRDKNISLDSKAMLMLMLLLSTFLYACESWNLTAKLEERIQTLEMLCFPRLLNITYKDNATNEGVRNKIQDAIGKHDSSPFYSEEGHPQMIRSYLNNIRHGQGNSARGSKMNKQERKTERWEDNVKDWTGLEFGESVRAVEDRVGWRCIVEMSYVVHHGPARLRD